MPKFLVSITRSPARSETLEVNAGSKEEACWLALSSTGAWKDAEDARVTATELPSPDGSHGLRVAA